MPIVAILENPNYIINIANAIRNVNGLGIDALYVIDGMKRLDDDPESLRKRKSLLKHSSGAVQFTDIKRFDTSRECLDFLREDGFVSVATSPKKAGKKHFFLHEARLGQPKLAIWFGDEGNGLSTAVLDECDFCVSIEMKGNVESFSLGSCTGMVLYEAARQRNMREF